MFPFEKLIEHFLVLLDDSVLLSAKLAFGVVDFFPVIDLVEFISHVLNGEVFEVIHLSFSLIGC